MVMIIIGLLFVFGSAEAQKKSSKTKVDPEFEKFWTEFKTAVSTSDKSWFENNTNFPFIRQAEFGYMGNLVSKEEYFEYFGFDKTEIKKISKIKLSTLNTFDKDEKTYSNWTENASDPAMMIPNGSKIFEIGYNADGCYKGFQFCKLNEKFYLIGEISGCDEVGE